jgi:hypothetical protein
MNNLQYLFNQVAKTQSRTIQLLEGAIVLYKRSGSAQWQCRFRLDNGSWFSYTTASEQVAEASTRAIEIFHKIQQKYASGEALVKALETIKIAVEAGELDSQIEIASAKLRSGFKHQ